MSSVRTAAETEVEKSEDWLVASQIVVRMACQIFRRRN